MLEIDASTSAMYLTKGDSATINITLQGSTDGYSNLHFYVRNANNLDTVRIHISSDNTGESTKGNITGSGDSWTVHIAPEATADMKRQKYVYDFKLTGSSNVTTFVGGGKNKTEFWVT